MHLDLAGGLKYMKNIATVIAIVVGAKGLEKKV